MSPNTASLVDDRDFKEDPLISSKNVKELNKDEHTNNTTKTKLVWRNIILFIILHSVAIYGLYLIFTSAYLITTIYTFVIYEMTGLGITAGAHRLWAHRSYTAKLPLTIFLVILNTMAFQNSIIEWSRDHRVHHKYSETDADPHNAKNGFFFSHMGWLLCKKHPDVKAKGKSIDMSDLEANPILAFQHRHYLALMVLFCFVVPVGIPIYFWKETLMNSFCLNILRYVCALHTTWLVNSAAHIWGNKPYDRSINPSENRFVAILAQGEGWHNYHHTFPWDYKTSELGIYSTNFAAAFIDTMASLGLAYNLKTVPSEVIRNRILRTGDGSHNTHMNNNIGEYQNRNVK